LHIAARMNWCEMIYLLLSLDANVDIKNLENKNTPLHVALEYGNLLAAQVLIKHGASLHSLNAHSQTPLQLFALRIGYDLPPLEANGKDQEHDATEMIECSEVNSLSLKENFTQMLADLNTPGKFADVSIQIDNRTISCHKVVLVSRSEYFREILSEPQKKTQSSPSPLKRIPQMYRFLHAMIVALPIDFQFQEYLSKNFPNSSIFYTPANVVSLSKTWLPFFILQIISSSKIYKKCVSIF